MKDFKNISWLGYAGFFLKDTITNKSLYIDPFDLHQSNLPKADLIFITHSHHDHFSAQDISKIIKEDTVIIAPSDCLEKIDTKTKQNFSVLPNMSYTINGFTFETIPAYNFKPEKQNKHARSFNWVGYIFDLNRKKIYHAGDTDFTPEMAKLKTLGLDFAIFPLCHQFAMGFDEAIEAANTIAAKYTMPIPKHYERLSKEVYREKLLKFQKEMINTQAVMLNELK